MYKFTQKLLMISYWNKGVENLSFWTCVVENSMSERFSLSVFDLLELEMEEVLFWFFTAEDILYCFFTLDSSSRTVVSKLKNIDYIKAWKWHPIKTICRSLTWNLRIFWRMSSFPCYCWKYKQWPEAKQNSLC